MTVLEKLAEFIKTAEERLIANEWLEDEKMQVYVRKGRHLVDGKQRVCLDIANVEVYEQQQGTWTDFIWKAHEMNPWDCTYVECVHNPMLATWLAREGFLPTMNGESFYLPRKKDWYERGRARGLETERSGEGF